ncbi:lema family protein [Variovorax sp.]|uniref:lema family protein n=1 Tax=Variovorax sp. TaxID=1871043 RepID=UPI002D6BB8C8|nr:lema family protein [Variovorax sp.]HYP83500.1 lema family protein [Variovorax sp.]
MNGLTQLIPASFHWWVVGAVLVFWFVGAYNRLVRMRSAAQAAYTALDSALNRQIDYVKARVGQARDGAAEGRSGGGDAPPAGSLNAVPEGAGGAALDLDAANSLWAAAAQTSAMMGVARLKPLDPVSIAALGTALDVLLQAWERLFPGEAVRFDAEGSLSRPAPLGGAALASVDAAGAESSGLPSSLAWPEPSAATEITRGQFNLLVLQYNRAIGQFPAVLVAWAFRLQRAAPLL